jgi:hypothetical protein
MNKFTTLTPRKRISMLHTNNKPYNAETIIITSPISPALNFVHASHIPALLDQRIMINQVGDATNRFIVSVEFTTVNVGPTL